MCARVKEKECEKAKQQQKERRHDADVPTSSPTAPFTHVCVCAQSWFRFLPSFYPSIPQTLNSPSFPFCFCVRVSSIQIEFFSSLATEIQTRYVIENGKRVVCTFTFALLSRGFRKSNVMFPAMWLRHHVHFTTLYECVSVSVSASVSFYPPTSFSPHPIPSSTASLWVGDGRGRGERHGKGRDWILGRKVKALHGMVYYYY